MNLFPYQAQGSRWLSDPRYRFRFLADEMGLGKSAQAIQGMGELGSYRRALVICPAIARTNWAREVELWREVPAGETLVLASLSDRPRADAYWTICSYEYASHNADALSAVGYDVLILDEAHYVCRRDANRSDALFGRNGARGIARSCDRVWWLTGTPVLTSPADLWLPFRVSGNTSLTYDAWLEAFCDVAPGSAFRAARPIGLKSGGAGAVLQKLIRDSGFVLRRLKEDVLTDLPPLFYQQIAVEPELDIPEVCAMGDIGLDQVALEAKLVEHALQSAEFRTDEMAILQGLAQSVSTLRRYLGLQKIGPAVTLVTSELEANAYPKILIAVEHVAGYDALLHRLSKFGVVGIRGDVSPSARDAAIEAFQTDPRIRVMVMQIRAGGVAINCHAADQVLVVECPWTPAVLQQLVARCHRIGQTRAVTARVMSLSTEPMDEAIVRLVVKRARDIKEVLGDSR